MRIEGKDAKWGQMQQAQIQKAAGESGKGESESQPAVQVHCLSNRQPVWGWEKMLCSRKPFGD